MPAKKPDSVRRILAGDPDLAVARLLAHCRDLTGADEVSLGHVEGKELVEREVLGKRKKREKVRLRIGAEGLGGWCAAHGKTAIVPDVRKDSRYVETSRTTRSEAVVPVRVGERLAAVLNLESARAGHFKPADRDLLEDLAAQVGLALRLEGLHRRAERLSVQLGMLNHLGRAGSMMETRPYLQRVAEALRGTFECSYAAVCLGDYRRERVVILAQAATSQRRLVPAGTILPFGKGMIGAAFKLGETVNARDVRRDPNYYAHISEVRSEIDVPVRAGDHCLGIIDAQSDQLGAFDEDETRTLETLARALVPVLQRAEVEGMLRG